MTPSTSAERTSIPRPVVDCDAEGSYRARTKTLHQRHCQSTPKAQDLSVNDQFPLISTS
jgi:hypothetical protein